VAHLRRSGSQNSIDRTGSTVPSQSVTGQGAGRSSSARSPCRRSAMRLYRTTRNRVARRRPGRSYDQPRVQRVTAAAPNLSRSESGRRRRPAAAAAGTPVTETRTSSGTSSTPPWSSTSSSPWMRSSPLTGHGSFGMGQGRFAPLGHPAVAPHGVVSRLPSRGRWAYQPLLRRPDPKPVLDYGYQDQPVLRQLRLGLADR
jgi:hypothetical protein